MIERLELVPYALRFRDPYVTARGRLDRRELLLVRIHADGAVGLGEAAPLVLRGGASLAEVARELDRACRPALEGSALDRSKLMSGCARRGVSRQGLAAVELALVDLSSKLEGIPAWGLLGAEQASAVRCNATLVAGDPSSVAAAALEWADRGFTTFKLKVGMESDVDQARAVRAALGPDVRLRVDANGVWTVEEAIARLRQLESLPLELAEQPAGSLASLAAVRRDVAVAIAADESVAGAEDAREAVALEACDSATVKIAKVGGIAAARAIAEALPVYLSSALDGPVGIAAAAHLAQVLPEAGLAHGLATSTLFRDTIASAECELDGAELMPTTAPGFGVEIDERALERARI